MIPSGLDTNGAVAFRWRQDGDDVFAEYPGLFTLSATAGGVLKSLEPADHLSDLAVEKLRNGFAAAFLRSLRGGYSLHASAVANARGGLLFIGESGSGKSTLAEHLCRHSGIRLLADDIAAVEQHDGAWKLVPSEGVHWVEGHCVGQKTPIPSRLPLAGPAPLLWIVSLRFDGSVKGPPLVSRRALRGADVITTLTTAALRFTSGPKTWLGEFAALTALASGAISLEIARTRTTPAARVVEAILTEVDRAK